MISTDRGRDVSGSVSSAKHTKGSHKRRVSPQSAYAVRCSAFVSRLIGLTCRSAPSNFPHAPSAGAAVKLCKVRSRTKGPCQNVVVAGELFCQEHLYHKDKVLSLPSPPPSTMCPSVKPRRLSLITCVPS